MAYKVFLDTNIIVDHFLADRPFHNEASELIGKIESRELFGFVSESVVNTTVYLLEKFLSVDDIRIYLNDMIQFIPVLPCSNNTIHKAYRLPTNDLEDAVLYQLALENELDYFVTSDKKGFKKISSSLLPVVRAKELMKWLQ